jgi:hypothetical protein
MMIVLEREKERNVLGLVGGIFNGGERDLDQ